MKPISLRIEGLRSYREPAKIDFEWLGGRGLFGIVGPTGAGKSTVLDALFLALYGETPRSKGSVSEVVPSDVAEASVELVFETLRAGVSERWRVRREWKRSRDRKTKELSAELKNRSELRRMDATQTLVAEQGEVTKRIVDTVVGIPYEDFERAVVLPQGAFDRLLRATPKDRNLLFGRVFGLGRLGDPLFAKASGRKAELERRRAELETKAGMVRVTPEELEAAREAERRANAALEGAREAARIAELAWKRAEDGAALAKRRADANGALAAVEKDRARVDLARTERDAADRAARAWPDVRRRQDLDRTLSDLLRQLEQAETEAARLEHARDALEAEAKVAQARLAEEEPSREAAVRLAHEAVKYDTAAREHEKRAADLARSGEATAATIKARTAESERRSGERKVAANDLGRLEAELATVKVGVEERAAVDRRYEAARALDDAGASLEKRRAEARADADALVAREDVLKEASRRLESGKETLRRATLDPALKLDPGEIERDVNAAALRRETARDLTRRLSDAERELGTETSRAREAGERAARATAAEEAAIAREVATEHHVALVETAHLQAEADLRDATQRSDAARLAMHLVDGAPCLVCGSDTHPFPARGDEDLSRRDAAVKDARSAVDAARKELDAARAGATRARTTKAAADESLATALEAVRTRQVAVDRVLAEAIAIPEIATGATAERTVALAAIEAHHEALLTAQKQANEARSAAQKEIAVAEKLVATETARVDSARVELERARARAAGSGAVYEAEQAAVAARTPAWELAAEGLGLIAARVAREALAARDLKAGEIEGLIRSRQAARDGIDRDLQRLAEETVELQRALDAARIESAAEARRAAEARAFIATIAGNVAPASHLATSVAALEALRQQARTTREKAERARTAAAQARAVAATHAQTSEKVTDELAQAVESERKGIEESGFSSADAVIAAMRLEAARHTLEELIRGFDARAAAAADLSERLDREIALFGAPLATETELAGARVARAGASAAVVAAERSEEAAKKELTAKQHAFEQGAQLRGELDALAPALARAETLTRLLQGQKLVQFAADRFLARILASATGHLRILSSDRYELTRDRTDGSFAIRDRHHAGLERPTTTLSGGESFLTSLALALALSDHIQKQGSVRFDFFFLDEGFGSLDEDTLDAALDALERLRGQQRVIGTISHVPAMHERLPRRLVVRSGGPGGSASVAHEE